MSPEIGAAAACSNVSRSGLRTSLSGVPTASSANEPLDDAHHLVAGPKVGHRRADGLDAAGDVPAADADLRRPEPEHRPGEVRLAAP